jgi:hypothetical protein
MLGGILIILILSTMRLRMRRASHQDFTRNHLNIESNFNHIDHSNNVIEDGRNNDNFQVECKYHMLCNFGKHHIKHNFSPKNGF